MSKRILTRTSGSGVILRTATVECVVNICAATSIAARRFLAKIICCNITLIMYRNNVFFSILNSVDLLSGSYQTVSVRMFLQNMLL